MIKQVIIPTPENLKAMPIGSRMDRVVLQRSGLHP
jgi:hypothetical protein